MTQVLVTGGAGFIGSHLVSELVRQNAQVTVVDNLNTGQDANLAGVSSRIATIPCALGEWLKTDEITRRPFDLVFHLAANAYVPPSVENPRFDFETNALNTFNLLEALRALPQPPRLVNLSSAAVYGSPTKMPIREDAPLDPISPYGVSKLTGERYAAVYAQLYGLRITSLRLFSVYGPRQRKQVVYDLLEKLRAEPHRIRVLGDGSQARDFIFVTDVVKAMLLIAERAPGKGEAINIASGVSHTIAELVTEWSKVLKVNPQVEFTGSVRPGDAERWEVDITALKELGFAPQVDLPKGLEMIRAWYDSDD